MEIAIIITAIAALVAGIVNLFVLFEIKRQPHASSKPILKVINGIEEPYIYTNEPFWFWRGEKRDAVVLTTTLYNFGAGPAINIKIKWDTDFEELISALKYFDPYNKMDFSKTPNAITIDKSMHSIDIQSKGYIAALTSNEPSNKQEIEIPIYYISAFEKHTELTRIKRPPKNDTKSFFNIDNPDLPELPPLKLNLEYEDINGGKYKQVFEISFFATLIYSMDKGDKNKKHSSRIIITVIEK